MSSDRSLNATATADVLLWQTSYRLVLALFAGTVAVGLRVVESITLSPVALQTLGMDLTDWLLGGVTAIYTAIVIGLRFRLRSAREAGVLVSSLMVGADVLMVCVLLFALASPALYYLGLFLALFSLQLSHVYFGRRPALSMLILTSGAYLVLNNIADRAGVPVTWGAVLGTLVLYTLGALLTVGVQSDLHERLGALAQIFAQAEEGDFRHEYAVAADKRPDAITAVGRAYNQMRNQLASVVLSDPLSGCFNRRGFEQQYRRELKRAARAHVDVALLAIDLDDFKAINETHGHAAGDRIIAEAGELLRASARAEDVVARTGGDEFTILAPNTTLEGAQHLAERVLLAFRKRGFVDARQPLSATVSVGLVATSVRDDSIAESLRARADDALQAAKRAGRNQLAVA